MRLGNVLCFVRRNTDLNACLDKTRFDGKGCILTRKWGAKRVVPGTLLDIDRVHTCCCMWGVVSAYASIVWQVEFNWDAQDQTLIAKRTAVYPCAYHHAWDTCTCIRCRYTWDLWGSQAPCSISIFFAGDIDIVVEHRNKELSYSTMVTRVFASSLYCADADKTDAYAPCLTLRTHHKHIPFDVSGRLGTCVAMRIALST